MSDQVSEVEPVIVEFVSQNNPDGHRYYFVGASLEDAKTDAQGIAFDFELPLRHRVITLVEATALLLTPADTRRGPAETAQLLDTAFQAVQRPSTGTKSFFLGALTPKSEVEQPANPVSDTDKIHPIADTSAHH
jgi:hypothetical protein